MIIKLVTYTYKLVTYTYRFGDSQSYYTLKVSLSVYKIWRFGGIRFRGIRFRGKIRFGGSQRSLSVYKIDTEVRTLQKMVFMILN